jgi:hypothetical protein
MLLEHDIHLQQYTLNHTPLRPQSSRYREPCLSQETILLDERRRIRGDFSTNLLNPISLHFFLILMFVPHFIIKMPPEPGRAGSTKYRDEERTRSGTRDRSEDC